jgi:hypothetical protein
VQKLANKRMQLNREGAMEPVPLGVMWISTLYVVFAAYSLWIGLHGIASILYLPLGLLVLGVSAFFILAAKALWQCQLWAWYASVALGGLSALSFVYALLRLTPQQNVLYTRVFQWSGFLISCVIVLYLSRTAVRSRFQ